MDDLEKRINGMTFNEYVNFIYRSWRREYRRKHVRHSEEEMEAIAREERLRKNWLCTPVSKMRLKKNR